MGVRSGVCAGHCLGCGAALAFKMVQGEVVKRDQWLKKEVKKVATLKKARHRLIPKRRAVLRAERQRAQERSRGRDQCGVRCCARNKQQRAERRCPN